MYIRVRRLFLFLLLLMLLMLQLANMTATRQHSQTWSSSCWRRLCSQ
jgi:hypothetical protein